MEKIYICRARHDAEWIPGQLLPENKACLVSLLNVVKSYKNYEVLQNVDNGSRLSWFDWDSFHTYPLGIVAGGENLFVARKKVASPEDNDVASHIEGALQSAKGYSHYLGKFNLKDGYGKITVTTEVIIASKLLTSQELSGGPVSG